MLAAVLMQEDKNSLELWAGGLRDLVSMKADISQYVLPTDMLLLQGQVEELHSQWEELCLKVSEREKERRESGRTGDWCSGTQCKPLGPLEMKGK